MNYNAQTLLAAALLHANVDLLRQALAYGADLNIPPPSGTPHLVALVRSVVCGMRHDMPLLNEILEHDIDVNQSDWQGATALHWAASADDAVLVRRLLDKGAAPMKVDSAGRTPLSQTRPGSTRTMLEEAAGAQFVPHAWVAIRV